MMRRVVLIVLLLGLAACAAPTEQDGGIGGTGAPAAREMAV